MAGSSRYLLNQLARHFQVSRSDADAISISDHENGLVHQTWNRFHYGMNNQIRLVDFTSYAGATSSVENKAKDSLLGSSYNASLKGMQSEICLRTEGGSSTKVLHCGAHSHDR